MANTIQLLDVVALTADLPENRLWRGQVGTVVDILADGAAFEVEFCDRDGRTYASLGLRPNHSKTTSHQLNTSNEAALRDFVSLGFTLCAT
jgi:hypothetical protein